MKERSYVGDMGGFGIPADVAKRWIDYSTTVDYRCTGTVDTNYKYDDIFVISYGGRRVGTNLYVKRAAFCGEVLRFACVRRIILSGRLYFFDILYALIADTLLIR